MVALAVVLIGIAGFFVLAMHRAPLWQWAVGALVLAILYYPFHFSGDSRETAAIAS